MNKIKWEIEVRREYKTLKILWELNGEHDLGDDKFVWYSAIETWSETPSKVQVENAVNMWTKRIKLANDLSEYANSLIGE